MRMDTLATDADAKSLEGDYQRKRLTLRRIDAELGNRPFRAEAGDPPALAREVEAQYRANRSAFEAALAEERSRLVKAKHDLSSAEQVKTKLTEVLPHYHQDKAFEKLAKDGYAGTIMASDKKRERIEKEQELKTQEFLIDPPEPASSSRRKNSPRSTPIIGANSTSKGTKSRAQPTNSAPGDRQAGAQAGTAGTQGVASRYRQGPGHPYGGTVVQPGTVLLTLVPKEETLRAEVWVSNEDIGFVRKGQPVKIKLAAFPFQKYGMVEGTVEHVSADSADNNTNNNPAQTDKGSKAPPLVYKALVALKAMRLEMDGERFPLGAGMQASAEILLGRRTVMEVPAFAGQESVS